MTHTLEPRLRGATCPEACAEVLGELVFVVDSGAGRSYAASMPDSTDELFPPMGGAKTTAEAGDAEIGGSPVMQLPLATNPEARTMPSAAPESFICLCGCVHYGEAVVLDPDAVPEPETQVTRFCRYYLTLEGGHTELTETSIWACDSYRPSAIHVLAHGLGDWKRNLERIREVRVGLSGSRRDDIGDLALRALNAVRRHLPKEKKS
jgi:hypothetical protein